jgi:hypothetical protein
MALNGTFHSQLSSNQPATTFISSTFVASGDGLGTNAFVVADPTSIQRVDITDETYGSGALSNNLVAATLLSTLADGPATVTNGGSGYTDGVHTGVVLTSATIATASATVTVAGGAVTSVQVTDGGAEYALSGTGVAVCTLSGGTPTIGAGSSASATVALTTGTGTGSIPVRLWVDTADCKAARMDPGSPAALGTGFPTAAGGFRVSLREAANKTCIAQAYAVGTVPTANMTISRVKLGLYKFAFNATRVRGSLPPVVVADARVALNQGLGVTTAGPPAVPGNSYSATVFAGIGLDGKGTTSGTFAINALVSYIDPVDGSVYVLTTDHNNEPADPYPGSNVSFSLTIRNSSAVV